ncbi:MAG: hypothetical protein IID45_01100 [Planctomycetes bacterium]|nr:hypothetical protein [Planctomycetota bacterium]
MSLLYSDIDPNYYSRLGYLRCPALSGSVGVPSMTDLEETGRLRLHELSKTDARRLFAEQYDRSHAGLPLFIDRNDDYWDFLFQKDTTDRFFDIEEMTGQSVGYLRLGRKVVLSDGGQPSGTAITIRDLALPDWSPETWSELINEIARLACTCESVRIEGWLPHTAAASALVSITPRKDEITMLKPLTSTMIIGEHTAASAEHFHEIDHV